MALTGRRKGNNRGSEVVGDYNEFAKSCDMINPGSVQIEYFF